MNATDAWVAGTIVRGNGKGRTLGFPTANIALNDLAQFPPTGVYACYARLEGDVFRAAVHAGPRPTIQDQQHVIEAHFLDFSDRDLYGLLCQIQFVQKLRDVEKFDTLEELVAAIKEDCTQTRELLTEYTDGNSNPS